MTFNLDFAKRHILGHRKLGSPGPGSIPLSERLIDRTGVQSRQAVNSSSKATGLSNLDP